MLRTMIYHIPQMWSPWSISVISVQWGIQVVEVQTGKDDVQEWWK